MVLLANLRIWQPEWKKGMIKIFSFVPEGESDEERRKWIDSIKSGILPISVNNIQMITFSNGDNKECVDKEMSPDAVLTVIGFSREDINQVYQKFTEYNNMGNILFVNAYRKKEIE